MRKAVVIVATLMVGVTFAACEPTNNEPDAAKQEQERQTQNYSSLTQTQPAGSMAYSPTRDTAAKFAETWEEKGKLSYVYLIDSVGHQIGYYIFEGLPVNYCASLTPPDKVEVNEGHYEGEFTATTRSAPAIDGMYYGNCNSNQYYGYDAVSGAYIEFTGGGSFNYLLSDQPMTEVDSKPLGDATIENVEK